MSDYYGDYAGIVLQVMEARPPLGEVVRYLDRQQRVVYETRKENDELRKENLRLHDVNTELHKDLQEQRKRLKPDGPLVSRKVLLLAVELLEDAGLFHEWGDTKEDFVYEIKQVTQHEEDV
jgi:hypothetical protein